jgi:hypothetical protein
MVKLSHCQYNCCSKCQRQGTQVLDLHWTLGLVAANLLFVFGNHFLVGLVVKLARAQSFAESGVFGSLTLFLDFTVLTLGAVTALIWFSNPFYPC